MDLVKGAAELKPMLVDFALSPRFEQEFSAVLEEDFPRLVIDDSTSTMVLDHFALQHQLPSGGTVVEALLRLTPS